MRQQLGKVVTAVTTSEFSAPIEDFTLDEGVLSRRIEPKAIRRRRHAEARRSGDVIVTVSSVVDAAQKHREVTRRFKAAFGDTEPVVRFWLPLQREELIWCVVLGPHVSGPDATVIAAEKDPRFPTVEGHPVATHLGREFRGPR
jgi:hypothetical protein